MPEKRILSISLSSKIAFMFTLLTVIIVLFFSVLTITLIRASLLSQKKEEIASVYNDIHNAFDVPFPVTKTYAAWLINRANVPFYILYSVFKEDGSTLLTNDPFIPRLPVTKPETVSRYREKGFYTDGDLDIIYMNGRLTKADRMGEPLYLQVSLDMAQDTTDSFLKKLPAVLLLCTIPLLLISWAAAKITSARLLKPIRAVISTAKNVDADKLDQRLPVPMADDELRELSLAFNATFARLEEDFIRQKRFTSDVSHELKTPLSVILGYTDILRRWGKADPAVLDKAIEAIYAESVSMKKLIEDLLLLSRTDRESAETLYPRESVLLVELLNNIRADTLILSPDTTFEIICDSQTHVQTNADALRQVFRIIISNSLAYSVPSAHITITVMSGPAKATAESTATAVNATVITIQDNGIGISADALPYVFDRFFRAEESRNRKSGGSGLGLSIAKNILEKLGGKITAESGPQGGTTIQITLC